MDVNEAIVNLVDEVAELDGNGSALFPDFQKLDFPYARLFWEIRDKVFLLIF